MKQMISYFFLLFSLTGFAQRKNVATYIDQVENSLMPFVPIKGFAGWNIIDRMKYHKVPGVSIAVIKDYKIHWAKGYGWADTSKKIKVTTSTMFSAGSISKLVMAVAALKMAENGDINLNAPINNYLSSWKIAENEFTKKTPVTLKMLLSHSAGTSQSSYFGFTPEQPLPSIVDILSGAPNAGTRSVVVNSEPNKAFRYSGGGSMIAQLALMDVSKKSFEALTQQVIFNKLKIKNTTFQQPLPLKYQQQSAWAYSNASWFKGMPYMYPQQAAAGLYSTPSDLAKIFIDLQKSLNGRGKILSKNMAATMLQPQFEVSNGSYLEQIAVGPFLMQRTNNNDPNGTYFEFTGVNAGFLAYGIASIYGGNGVIIMMNSGDDVNGFGKEVRRAVAKVYNWTNFLPEEIVPIQLPNIALDKFTGRYRMSANEVLYLRKENNYLVENINEGNDIYCFPISKDSIVFTDYNIKGFFIRDDKNEIVGLQNIYQQQPMPKMKANEFTAGEYLLQKNYAAAKMAFAQLGLNEFQITYLAYELLNKKSFDPQAVYTILTLGIEKHPNSSIVYSRWGDYHLKMKDKTAAIASYKKAVELDSSNEQTNSILKTLLQ